MKTQTKTRTWFAGITDPDQLQAIYKALALQYHPDRGGDTAVMQEINSQYDQAKKLLEAPAPSRKYSQPQPKTNHYDPFNRVSDYPSPEAAVAAVLAQHRCPGVHIEFLGGEAIARGQVYENRETLKSLGFWWDPENRYWHFVKRPAPGRKGAA